MRVKGAISGLLLMLGCSGADPRVAVEDLGEVDLRVVVARAGETAEVRILDATEAYRYTAEPLADVFARGDQLQVYVLGYSLQTIEAAFPGLEGRAVGDIIGRLRPHLEPAGPGRFDPPDPDAVLFAAVAEGGDADVTYEPRSWSQVQDEISLRLELAGDLACPPAGAVVRAFSRDAPGRVCIFNRSQDCEWSRLGNPPCADQDRIFGVEGTIVEQPNGSLRVGQTICAPTEARDGSGALRGESAAYVCDGRIVAVQVQPLDERGELWSPQPGPRIDNAETSRPGQWVPVDPGVLFAFEAADDIEVRRIGVGAQGEDVYETLSHPVVDSPLARQRRASSADGTTVTLSGDGFERNVGSATDQCFRRVDGTRPLEWSLVERREAQDTLTLSAPMTPFSSELDWQVVGDPGQDFVMSPQVVEARLPAGTGGLDRVSVSAERFPAALLVHGRNRTFRLPPVTRFEGDTHFVSCPRELTRPGDLTGPVIAAPDGYYAMVTDGIRRIAIDGTFGRLLDSGPDTFSPSWTLTRTVNRQSAERVVVYREGVVHLFDPGGTIHDRLTVDGRIVGVLPGPLLFYLPATEGFALRQVTVLRGQLTDEIEFTVPAVSEGNPPALEVRPEAVRALDRRVLVGFSSGDYAGVLDTRTGLSSAADVSPGAKVVALFGGDDGDATWAAVTTSGGSVELLQLPLPAGE